MKNQNFTTKKVYDLKLTELESLVLIRLVFMLDKEPYFTDTTHNDLANSLVKPINTIKGVVTSLVKKKIVFVDEDYDRPSLITLEPDFFYIHPNWSGKQ